MVTLIHSADWQIGLKADHVAAAAPAVRQARLAAARAVVAAASNPRADALVLAGDQFEDNLVEDGLVRQVVELLATCPVPVFVLPGNHDALTQDSVYRRRSWLERPPHLVLMDAPGPYPIPGTDALLLAAPVRQKKSFQDPTSSFPPAPEGGAVVIGVAHGSLAIEGKYSADDFPIPLDTASTRGVDYLALGHWHGCLVHRERTAYSGTHETTSFGESRSGQALRVSIAGRGAVPAVSEVPTGQLSWQTRELPLDEQDPGGAVTQLRSWAEQLPSPGTVLLRLQVRGTSTDEANRLLGELADDLGRRLLHVVLDRGDLPAATARGRIATVAASSALVAALLADLEAADEPAAVRATARRLLGELVLEAWP